MNKNMGWLTIVLAIASYVVPLIIKGVASNDAVNQAKAQLNLQRSLNEQEKLQLAQVLHNSFASVSVEDFLVSINLAETQGTNGNNKPPEPKAETNYWIYLAVFIGILVITK